MSLFEKLRILTGLNKAVNQAQNILKNPTPMKLKPGIKTTEFWITLGLGLGSVILATLDQIDGTTAASAATILGAVYTASRGYLKAEG